MAIAYVGGIAAANTASGTGLTTSSYTVSAGSLVVAVWQHQHDNVAGGTPTVTISDSRSGTWTAADNQTAGIASVQDGRRVGIAYLMNAAAGSTTFTQTISDSRTERSLVILEYSGAATSSALLTTGKAYNASGNATSSAMTATGPSLTVLVAQTATGANLGDWTGGTVGGNATTDRGTGFSAVNFVHDRLTTGNLSGATAVASNANTGIDKIIVAAIFAEAGATAPNPPTGVTSGSVTAYSATASWTDNSSDETGFKVQYAPSPYSSWTTLSGSPAAADATSLATGNVLTPGDSYKFRVASTNANGDSAYVESGIFTATPLTFLRPIADTSNGAWTASSGSDRYALIDESSTNDADYISVASASTYKTRLTSVSDPGVNTDHSVVVRAKGDGSSQLTIALVQGDPTETAIASTTVTPTVSYANYTLTVTSGQAANITDYSLLYLKLTSL